MKVVSGYFGVVATAVVVSVFLLGGCSDEAEGPSSNQGECETGDEGCECYGNDTCNGNLQCVAGLCVADEEPSDVGGNDGGVEFDASEEPETGPVVEDGLCGSNSGEHYREVHDWPGEFCAAGTLTEEAPEMPEPLSSVSWSCEGENGGETAQCEAARVDECSPERLPPSGWTRIEDGCDPQGYADGCTEWGPGGIWPVGFPGGSGLTRRLASGLGSIPQYLAIEIRTFDKLADGYGRIDMDSAGAPIPNVPQQIMSISSCPGDFNEEAIMADTGCYGRFGTIYSITWQGPEAEPTPAYASECVLEPNRTYYWNIIPSNSELGTDPEDLEIDPVCLEGGRCGMIYSPDLAHPSESAVWPDVCDPDNENCP